MDDQAEVVVVEDDVHMRQALLWLLERAGLPAAGFSRPSQVLSDCKLDRTGCLVLDFNLPEMNALELQQRVTDLCRSIPFLIVTGHGSVPLAVESMLRCGAIDYLQKPFNHSLFLSRVREALQQDAEDREMEQKRREFVCSYQALTVREQEILRLVAAGRATKQIAAELEISSKTVEVHRSNVTRKMRVDSVAHLVRKATAFIPDEIPKPELRLHDS